MARQVAKCGDCGAVFWIGDADPSPQRAQCLCGATYVDEDGPGGNHVELTEEELAEVP